MFAQKILLDIKGNAICQEQLIWKGGCLSAIYRIAGYYFALQRDYNMQKWALNGYTG